MLYVMTDLREPDPLRKEGKTTMRQRLARPATGLTLSTCFLIVAGILIWRQLPLLAEPGTYRGLLGEDNTKVRQDNGRTLLWAAGDPDSPDAEWYDFTGAPIPTAELQFGIGKDRIPAIDDPIFVSPDDPRLLEIPQSPYRPVESPETNEDIVVIGYVQGDDVRAYPIALLDGHELVNDVLGGKPVTVGW